MQAQESEEQHVGETSNQVDSQQMQQSKRSFPQFPPVLPPGPLSPWNMQWILFKYSSILLPNSCFNSYLFSILWTLAEDIAKIWCLLDGKHQNSSICSSKYVYLLSFPPSPLLYLILFPIFSFPFILELPFIYDAASQLTYKIGIGCWSQLLKEKDMPPSKWNAS